LAHRFGSEADALVVTPATRAVASPTRISIRFKVPPSLRDYESGVADRAIISRGEPDFHRGTDLFRVEIEIP